MKNCYHFIHWRHNKRVCASVQLMSKNVRFSVLPHPFERKQRKRFALLVCYIADSASLIVICEWNMRRAIRRPPFRFLRHKKLLEPFIGQWRGLFVIFQSFFTLRCFLLLAGHQELLAGIFRRGLNPHKVEDDAIFEVTQTLCKNSSIWRVW